MSYLTFCTLVSSCQHQSSAHLCLRIGQFNFISDEQTLNKRFGTKKTSFIRYDVYYRDEEENE